jgi:glycosyltransferase involved in cell wall biosynthesis
VRRQLVVAFLIEKLTDPGGTERQCVELARALTDLGHQVTVMTVEGSLGVHEKKEIDQKISFVRIGASRFGLWIGQLHPKLGQAWDMIRLGLSARRLPRAAILMAHHYPAHWASFVATVFTKRPAIWLCNDWIYQPLQPRRTPTRLLRIALRAAMVSADGFVARRCAAVFVLGYLTRAAVSRGYRVKPEVFRTGASGSDAWPRTQEQRGKAREGLGIPKHAYLVSSVCILMPHRRVEDAIRAVAQLKGRVSNDVYFVHVGGSADRRLPQNLEDLAKQEGVAHRVRLLGAVPDSVRRQVIEASDAFVFPEKGQSWGLAPLESMAAGVPTIISAANGLTEVLRHERDVLVYNSGDADALAHLITRLHDCPEEAGRLAQAGYGRWQLRFTWQRAARRLSRQLSRRQPLDGR